MFKLAQSRRPEKRAALLAFLEQAAEAGEPAALEMRESRGAEVYALVAALRDAREGRPSAAAPPEALSNLVRAVAALATCAPNRRYLLEAGCLDALAEALAAPDPGLATLAVQVRARTSGVEHAAGGLLAAGACAAEAPAASAISANWSVRLKLATLACCSQALAMLAREEESPRLAALDSRVLGRMLSMLREPPSADALLAALAAITCLADAYPAHRCGAAASAVVAWGFLARSRLIGASPG